MKSLCITGNVSQRTQTWTDILHEAGAMPARPAVLHDREVGIDEWHARVTAGPHGPGGAPPRLGRVWEQLAAAIFLANHGEPLWCWRAPCEPTLLRFWADFDPGVHVLIVHTAPQALLADLAAADEAPDAARVTRALDDWCRATRTALDFHRAYPGRSVLLDGAAASDPRAAVGALAQHWGLSLVAPAAAGAADEAPDAALARFVTARVLEHHAEALALQTEAADLLIARTASDGPADGAALPAFAAWWRERRAQADEAAAARERAARLEAARAADAARITRLERTAAREKALRASLDAARRDLADERARRAEDTAAHEAALAALRDEAQARAAAHAGAAERAERLAARCAQAEEEAALLLAQLLETQEALEASAARCQSLEMRLTEAEAESASLLPQLHAAQEALEAALHATPAAPADAPRAPRLEVEIQEQQGSTHSSLWRYRNARLGGRHLGEIRFRLLAADGMAGLVIQRTGGPDAPDPLLRWPGSLHERGELPCIPTTGTASQGGNAVLSALGPADWALLRGLVQTLAGTLAEANAARLPPAFDRERVRPALLALQRTLATWPEVLRYDTIALAGEVTSHSYSALDIRLVNVQLGELAWPDLTYRLACARGPDGDFAANPRLEFDESARERLQYWFAETVDERGARLELRAESPDVIDVEVWESLAPNDRLLVGGLVATLPAQLLDLRAAHPSLRREWQQAAGTLRAAVAANLARRQQAALQS